MDEIKRVGRELKFAGKIVDFYQDDMLLPNGSHATWDYIAHRKGAACVLPILDNGHVLMVRQYRNAINRYTLEIPAGAKDDPSEPSAVCATRELEEETGYRSEHLETLVKVATTVAFCNEQLEIFIARDLQRTQQHLDEDEFINVEEWDIRDLVKKVMNFEIQDSKTVAAIMTYYTKYIVKDVT